MAFSFAAQPQDYLLRAQAGLPLDPSLSGDQLSAQAGQMLDAPPRQSAPQQSAPRPAAATISPYQGIPDIKVSPAEALMSWLAHGGTPGEAAEQARAVKVHNMSLGLQLMQAGTQQRILQSVADDMSGGPPQGAMPPPPAGSPPPGQSSGSPMPFRGVSPRTMSALAFVNPQAADALASIQKLNEVAVGTDGRTYRKYDPSSVPARFGAPTLVNGTVRDINDPANLNQYTPAPPTAGAEPLYDRYGNIVDWRLPSGVRGSIQLQNLPAMTRAQASVVEAGAAVRNAGTSAANQQNTASQNTAAPPAGFTVRARRR